jgi:hypothetical protein
MVDGSTTSCLLVGVDGSAESSNALEWAAATGARLDLLVVAVTTFEDLVDCLCGTSGRREHDLFTRRQRMVTDVMDRHPDADISQWWVAGPLADCLCRMARSDDLLVVPAYANPRRGSHLSAYCRAYGPCTVIVVPIDQPPEPKERPRVDLQEATAEPPSWLG